MDTKETQNEHKTNTKWTLKDNMDTKQTKWTQKDTKWTQNKHKKTRNGHKMTQHAQKRPKKTPFPNQSTHIHLHSVFARLPRVHRQRISQINRINRNKEEQRRREAPLCEQLECHVFNLPST